MDASTESARAARQDGAAADAAADGAGPFRAVLETVQAVGVLLDAAGRITFANDFLLRLTGWARDEVIGQDWFARFLPVDADRDALRARFLASLARGEIFPHHENAIVTRAGEQRLIAWDNVLLRAPAPIRGADAAPVPALAVGTASIGRDVTAEREARAEWEAAALALRAQAGELATANEQLQEQAVELEAQTDALQATAADLAQQVEAAERARGALAASEAKFRAVMEAMSEGVMMFDADGTVIYHNPASARIHGVASEAEGRFRRDELPTTWRGWGPDGAEVPFAGWPIARVLRGERVEGQVLHAERVATDGAVRHAFDASYNGAAIRDGAGDFVVGFITLRDIGEERRAAAALARSEAKYRTLFERMEQGFCLIEVAFDGDGPGARAVDYRFLETNPAFERQTGLSDAAGRSARELVPGLEGHWFATYGSVARTGEPARFEDHSPALGRWFEVEAFRVGASGQHRVAVLFTDVTERHLATAERERLLIATEQARDAARRERAEAEAANRSKGEFLANMSHELRTPLNAIQGHVQLMEMELHGPLTDRQRDALGRVARAQTHLLGLINDVLNYARLEAGRTVFDVRAVDAADVIEDMVRMFEPQLVAKGLGVTVDLGEPGTAPQVWADADKLGQVLLNLLSNAVKFTPSVQVDGVPGRIVLALSTVDEEPGGEEPAGEESALAFLHVRDTGIGIPADKQDSIFEPFVQVSTGLTRAHEGTGLGLAISRDLARGMGGELRVRSTQGAGATFTVVLRRVVDAAGRPTERRTEEARPTGGAA